MSKLADLIRRATRPEPPALGFGSAATQRPHTMLLVGLAGDHWARAVGDAAETDAVFLAGRPREQDINDAIRAAGSTPCGASIADYDEGSLGRLREAGLDFAVLTTQSAASMLLEEDIGFVLQLREELTDIQLRTLENRPFDALLVEQDTHPLTIRRQIDLQRVSGLSRKALIVPVRPNADQSDLLALRESGAALLVLDLGDRGAADSVARIRGLIGSLPPRRAPRSEEREVSILGAVRSADEDDDEVDRR